MRVLRIELRRSAAPVLGVALFVAAVALLHLLSGPWGKGSAPWDEQWTGLAQWSRYLLIFLWPFVLGGGAWQGLRDHRSRISELRSSTPRPAARRALPTAGALAIGLTVGFLGVLAVGAVRVAAYTDYLHLKWVPITVVGVLAIVAAAWVGLAVGRLVPSLLVPPVLVVAGLAAQIALLRGGGPELLSPVFQSMDISAFTIVPLSVTLVQAAWFGGLAATGFLLFTVSRPRARIAALAPAALGLALAVALLPGLDHGVADADAAELVCDDDGPSVCVTRAHAAALPNIAGPARKALADLAKLPTAPTSVRELVPAHELAPPGPAKPERPRPADVVLVDLADGIFRGDSDVLSDPDALRLVVLAGAGTPACDEQPENWDAALRTIVARTVTAAWFTGELAPLPGERWTWEADRDEFQQAWSRLRALPSDEQRDRVAAYRTAALNCEDDLLSVLVP